MTWQFCFGAVVLCGQVVNQFAATLDTSSHRVLYLSQFAASIGRKALTWFSVNRCAEPGKEIVYKRSCSDPIPGRMSIDRVVELGTSFTYSGLRIHKEG